MWTPPEEDFLEDTESQEWVPPTTDLAESESAKIPWSDVPQNAIEDIGAMGKGIYELGKSGTEMMVNAATGNVPALMKQARSAVDIASEIPGGLIETGKKYITEPVESFKEHPVQMATDIAAIGMPALKATKAADVGASVAKFAGKQAKKIAPAVEKLGADARIGSMGITPSDIGTRASDLEAMNKATKLLQAEGATPKVLESASTSLERLEKFAKSPGQLVRRIPDYLDEFQIKPQMKPQSLALHLENQLLPNKVGGAYKVEASLAKEIGDTARAHGQSFKDLLDLKQKLQETAYGSRSATTEQATLRAQMYQDATRIVDNIIEQEIKDAAPELATPWIEANRKYSAFKDVEPSMIRAQNKAASQGVTKFTDFDITRPLQPFKRGINTAVASITDKLTELAQTAPDRLGKFASNIQNAVNKGPQALAATHYVLQQRDPEYVEFLKQLNEEKTNEE